MTFSLAEAVYLYSIILGRMDANAASLAETNPAVLLTLRALSTHDYRRKAALAPHNRNYPRSVSTNHPHLLRKHSDLRQDTVPVKFCVAYDVKKRVQNVVFSVVSKLF